MEKTKEISLVECPFQWEQKKMLILKGSVIFFSSFESTKENQKKIERQGYTGSCETKTKTKKPFDQKNLKTPLNMKQKWLLIRKTSAIWKIRQGKKYKLVAGKQNSVWWCAFSKGNNWWWNWGKTRFWKKFYLIKFKTYHLEIMNIQNP